jgi:hypothetical protein
MRAQALKLVTRFLEKPRRHILRAGRLVAHFDSGVLAKRADVLCGDVRESIRIGSQAIERTPERVAMRKIEIGVAGRQRRGHVGVEAIQMRRQGECGCERRLQDHLIALAAADEC